MTRKDLAAELAVLLVLAVAVGAMFWEALLLRGAFFVQDVMVQNYPFRHFFSTALKEWSLPLWHPGINCGFPLFAEGQSGVLYPFNLITSLLLSTHAALSYNIAFHLWLGSVGMYAFLRQLRCARSPAIAGALAYGLSGYLVVRAMSPNYIDVCAWMPFLFLFLELACRRNRWVYVWLAAGVVGLQFLAGHPQATAYSVGAAVLYGLHKSLGRGKRTFAAAVVFVAPILGVGVAAVQLLPTAELVQLSGRSEGVSLAQFVNMSLPPERLITLLLPSFFGNSATGSYWGEEAGFFIQLCPYLGVLPLVLCMVAARERDDGPTKFFTVLIGASFLLALGRHTALFESLYGIPGLSFFRIPTRFLLWWGFGGAALAGLGLDHIVKRGIDASRRTMYTSLCVLLAAVAGGAIWLNAEALSSNAGLSALPGQAVRLLAQYRTDLISDGLRCALMLAVAVLVVSGRRWIRRGWWRTALTWLAPVAIAADLGSFGRDFNSVIDPEVYLRTPDSAAFIHRDATGPTAAASAFGAGAADDPDLPMTGRFRCASLISERNAPYDWHSGWSLERTSYRRYPETLRMYTASVYGLANTLPGWSPLHLRRHWEFMRGYPRLLSVANVAYAVSHRPLQLPGLEEAYRGEVRVYRNSNALPRCYVTGNNEFSVVAGAQERMRYLLGDRFRPGREVVLAEAPPPLEMVGGGSGDQSVSMQAVDEANARGASPGTARISLYRPERVEVELQGIGEAGFLVLSDSHYPGWRAEVDGVETPVLLANHVFRAIRIPAGARTALFEFQPLSFRLGGWISVLSVAALAALAWTGVNRRIWPEEQPADGAGGAGLISLKAWTVQIFLILVLHAMVRNWPFWSEALDRCRVLSSWGVG